MTKAAKCNFEQLKNKVREESLLIYLKCRIRWDSYVLKYQRLKNRIRAKFLL